MLELLCEKLWGVPAAQWFSGDATDSSARRYFGFYF